MKYAVGETESFFLDGDGTVIPDCVMRDAHPLIEWEVAVWREARFGIPPRSDVLNHKIEHYFLGWYYLNGHRGGTLPPGSDRCWSRGIWVPVSWGHTP